MEPESYAQLLGKLGDELRRWALALFYDERLHGNIDTDFDRFIDDARLSVFVKLGAERREFLAAAIDAQLNRVKEHSKAFAGACRDARPRGRRQSSEGLTRRPFVEYLGHQVSFPPKAVHAADNLWIVLNRCDALFAMIDGEIQQADSPGRGKSNGYKYRFEPVSYSPTDICDELNITTATLNKYAKAAGIETPQKGKRNHRYSSKDRQIVFQYISANVSETKICRAAREMLAEIESKSKDRK